MIVCVCRRISDRQITEAARTGVRCFEQLQKATQVSTCCGACEPCARETLEEALHGEDLQAAAAAL